MECLIGVTVLLGEMGVIGARLYGMPMDQLEVHRRHKGHKGHKEGGIRAPYSEKSPVYH